MAVLSFGSNISSISAQRQLSQNSSLLGFISERLSSGQRINRASDDAAGLAIASTLRSSSRVFTQALRNVNDAQSALAINSGALGELSGVVTRLRELAGQSANGTYSLTQRRSLSEESDSLIREFNRIIGSTQFNGINLLDRSLRTMRIQAGYGIDGGLQLGLAESLHRNVGNGSFGTQVSYASGTLTNTASINADVTGDNVLDIISVDGVNQVINIYRGNGDGSFGYHDQIGATSGVNTSIAAGDLNNDGLNDLAITNGTFFYVYTNSGDGQFAPEVQFDNTTNARAIDIADFDQDGVQDIAIGSTSAVNIFLGQGGATFSASTSYSIGASAQITDMAIGDLNADGILDIAARNNNIQGLGVILGAANGTFGAVRSITLGYSPSSLEIGDLDNDGYGDIVAASGTTTAVSVLRGQGGGTFAAAENYTANGATTKMVKLSDINGDGYLDILSGISTGVSTFIGRQDGTFEDRRDSTLTGAQRLMVGDFNGDGVSDIAGTPGSGATVYIGLAETDEVSTIAYLNLNSIQGARDAMETLDQILQRIGLEVGSIGSYESRLQTAYQNLLATRENYDSAAGRITDIDVASESSNLVRQQILQQTAAAVLAQANTLPEIGLALLRT